MENLHHVHEVLEMLSFANQDFSRDNLELEIKIIFGEDARFLSCADCSFDAHEIIDFMLSKNKIQEKEGTIKLISQPCDH